MALHIFHNRAEHTHENEQFRRIAKDLKVLFDNMKWDGILIGNPSNPDFRRFRADAILYYSFGLLVIDLKDYAGDIKLPPNSREFKTTKWYAETEKDKKRIEIKGGSFINPFIQLNTYRDTLNELIRSNLIIAEKTDASKIGAINIFSGNIKLNRETPRDIPYYRIIQESEFQTFLYDFASKNCYFESVADELKKLFPAEPWLEQLKFTGQDVAAPKTYDTIDGSIQNIVSDFLDDPKQQVLILESSNTDTRDNWMRHILSVSVDHNIPQTEIWAHSTRIAKRIKTRTGIEPSSLYTTLFGGTDLLKSDEEKEAKDALSDDQNLEIPDQMQEIIGIRADKQLDESCMIILFEAHLVTRSLHQSELLKFGTGRLLEDLFTHLRLNETKRKLICIGDPFSLSYGKESESALSKATVSELYHGEIQCFREESEDESTDALPKLISHIGSSINEDIFNNLHYDWDENTLCQIDKPSSEILLKKWFEKQIISEPDYAVLLYKNSDVSKVNNWIRKHAQGKQEDFVAGDLLLVNNNFKIPDETGLAFPQQISNGTFLKVESRHDSKSEEIPLRGNQPVTLTFHHLKISCIGASASTVSDIWILENYFRNHNELTIQEQKAFRAFVYQRVAEYKKEFTFEQSHDFEYLKSSNEYIKLNKLIEDYENQIDDGKRVKTKKNDAEAELKRLIRKVKSNYDKTCLMHVLNNDSFVNAAFVQYGYAINVHKALGSTFRDVLFNTFQGDTFGTTNAQYFRWLYTGLSCVGRKAYIINPISINPLMNCVFEDIDSITSIVDTSTPKPKNKLIFPEIEPFSEINEVLDPNLPLNVRRGVIALSQILLPKGYILETVETANYIVKPVFTTPEGNELNNNDRLRLVMNYNKKSEVSSLRIEHLGKSDERLIENSITELIAIGSNIQAIKSKVDGLPDDFRYEVYKEWQLQSVLLGYQLSIIEEHNNQDVFLVQNQDDSAKFRVWYTSDGFFTKIIMIERSSEKISSDIKKIIFYGTENRT